MSSDTNTQMAIRLIHGYTDAKITPDGDVACIHRFMFTYAILVGLNPSGYDDRWCYGSYGKAKAALEAWDGTGEPTGWHRHPDTGRRVNEETGEMYVNW